MREGHRTRNNQTRRGHPSFYLTFKRKGKTVTVYVPKDRVAELRGWVLEHKRVKVLLREIPELGLAETARVIAGAPRQAKCCGRLLAGEGGLEPEPEAAGAVLAPGAPARPFDPSLGGDVSGAARRSELSHDGRGHAAGA